MQSRQPATLGVSVTVFILASVFVALRFISRVFVVREVGLHDWLMLLAWVCDFPGLVQTLHLPGVGCAPECGNWLLSQHFLYEPSADES